MIAALVFLLGLVVGSFLSAFIYRLEVRDGLAVYPRGQRDLMHELFSGRSLCPSCGHQLAWHDLIPLLSFVLLQGKCRYCKKKISPQYPLVELAAALLFLAIFAKFVPPVENLIPLSLLWTIASALLVIFVYDLKHFIIPDKVLYPAIGLVLLWHALLYFQVVENLTPLSFVGGMLSGVGAAAFFFAIYLLSKGRAMGFGDVKLAFFMGLFLGFPNILVALALAFGVGALVGLALLASKRKTMRSEVPFGPFLVLGTIVALFWGEQLVNFYMNFIL